MEAIRRPRAAAMLAASAASTVLGIWLHLGGGGPTPAGFVQYAAVALGAGALGAFVVWHRPGHRYGTAHLAVGVLFGTVVLAAGLLSRGRAQGTSSGWIEQLALGWSWVAAAALLPLWIVVIAAFPDGHFHRDGVRQATVAVALLMPLLAVVAYLLAPSGEPPPLIRVEPPPGLAGPLAPAGDPHVLHRLASVAAGVLGALAPVGAVVALLDRFRTAGPVLRQQIKWLLTGAAISVALQAIPVHAIASDELRLLALSVVLLAVPLPLLAAAIAIFRYRLWEIDVVISKGLVYGLASGVLAALFSAVALVAGVTVGGRDSRVVAALGLALLVSFLAQPLKKRLEGVVARLLYGDQPRGLLALAQLEELAAPSTDARQLGARIADAARGALGASWAGIWLYVPGEGAGALRPLATSGAEPGSAAVLPAGVPSALRSAAATMAFEDLPVELRDGLRPLCSAAPVLVAPLTSRTSLVGLLACGERPRDPFGDEDIELFAVVARESALALRNINLEEELRQRLEQIEQQAAELRRSRQRLVTAQDRERRRIERDLHDGAQQQLVVLAARLRQLARGSGSDPDRALEDLADEAEHAVFALQDLARGIYPSVLVDRGLHAALQGHAARVPANVRVEVEPGLHGRRFPSEVESALYFVGLEAMTNAVKHAPGGCIIVSLRSDPETQTVTLEVHDDGPGFEVAGAAAGAGAGLQNMSDRIDALGGTFSVESAAGGGTWVRARVQTGAEVRALRGREATS